ncbi:MAG TPA: hypothetical protein PK167_09810 [Prolixibacteraceae bacterium]|nr:hypothetical protein [Prolixibacteraceae bacterium]
MIAGLLIVPATLFSQPVPDAFRCFLQKSYAAGDLTNREAGIRKAETSLRENSGLVVEILPARYGLTGSVIWQR